MSVYSSLILAANDGRRPSRATVQALIGELGLAQPGRHKHEIGNLADHVNALFQDAEALAENRRFFCPDSIGVERSVLIQSIDEEYDGSGWCVTIHGNGYFFPWSLTDLRDRVCRSPALLRLREAVDERFGGRFILPEPDEHDLRSRLIDTAGGWAWFASESF